MKIGNKLYEDILTDILKDIAYSYKNGHLDKFTLDVIGSNILYIYAIKRLKYDSDKALDFSVKYFNNLIGEERLVNGDLKDSKSE